ncbi:hypothetical protein DZF91_16155 [Actinomadura logoneensis]|uniref:Uncharacterized protein n=1 Tax=Actinomadura logoneensis TaxID=2293572 RepID=A0A372JKT1_9ACTN|nr:hypothetical protein [Actinomadura logoneensis]RFU40627.1 hypothetical protein DZF91_16155 [Actinomadura logoneensis]
MTVTVQDVRVIGDDGQNLIGTTVHGDVVKNQIRFVRGRSAMYLGPSEIHDHIAGHVPARNHDLIVKTLAAEHVVTLCGPPGSGRRTTAIAALRRVHPAADIRLFSPEQDEMVEISVSAACGYLVDGDAETPTALGGLSDAVRAKGAFAVVFTTTPTTASITLDPPDPVEVYRRRVARLGLGPAWIRWNRAPALLADASPADARRLADIAAEAGSPAEAEESFRHWSDELSRWFAAHPEPHDRALLVAAATLRSAVPTDVYTVAASLLRRLDVTVHGSGLAWCPAAELRGVLSAAADSARVEFRRHGFPESVLRHVWDDYPLIRSDLLGWLAALPADPAVPGALWAGLAETFADLAAEHGAAEQITRTAETWAENDQADLAYIALARTCLDPLVGGRVRTAMYRWSREENLAQTLKLTLVRACQTLAETYTSIALTRLKHLATNGNDQVRVEVVEALLKLASDHPDEILVAILTWAKGAGVENLSARREARRKATAAAVFLRWGLTPEEVDPHMTVPAWRAALETRNPRLEPALHTWLETTQTVPGLTPAILWTLVEAADESTADLLISLTRRWATTPARFQIHTQLAIRLTRPWWRRLHLRVRLYFESFRMARW